MKPTQRQIEAALQAYTQAQIDAAARALYPTGRPPSVRACAMAKAALTAAAEAGPMFECPKCGADLAAVDNPHQCIAAEAVEQKAIKLGSWEQKTVNATIERCAQLAENFEWNKDDDNSTLAAAIRALKEKP